MRTLKQIIIYYIVIIIFFSFHYTLSSEGPLKLIKSIGDERDDYTFLGMTDAIITGNKNIFVLNTRGNFISQFDWGGQFKRRIGQKGQGPGDFNFPWSLAFAKEKLYIHDRGNRRIVELNLKSDKYNFYKESTDDNFIKMKHVIDGELFLGIFFSIKKNRGRLGIVDKNFKTTRSFFSNYPIQPNIKGENLNIRTGMSSDQIFRNIVMNNRFEPVYCYNDVRKEIFVSFRTPDNPVRFFVYDVDGKLLKEFSYAIEDKKYKFNRFFLDSPRSKIRDKKKWPERFEPNIRVMITNRYYLAFLALHDYNAQEKDIAKRKCFLLIFDKEGKLVKKSQLDDQFGAIRYSNGYILGTIWEEDDEKLFIYQLKLPLNE
jgi:6-bladed beta-propeller